MQKRTGLHELGQASSVTSIDESLTSHIALALSAHSKVEMGVTKPSHNTLKGLLHKALVDRRSFTHFR